MPQETFTTSEPNARRKSILLVNSGSRLGLEGFEQAKQHLQNFGGERCGGTLHQERGFSPP